MLFLESAELHVKERKDLTLDFWRGNVDVLLNFQNKKLLQGAGSVSNNQMEQIVGNIYDDFNARRKRYEADQADAEDLKELTEIQKRIDGKK